MPSLPEAHDFSPAQASASDMGMFRTLADDRMPRTKLPVVETPAIPADANRAH